MAASRLASSALDNLSYFPAMIRFPVTNPPSLTESKHQGRHLRSPPYLAHGCAYWRFPVRPAQIKPIHPPLLRQSFLQQIPQPVHVQLSIHHLIDRSTLPIMPELTHKSRVMMDYPKILIQHDGRRVDQVQHL